MSSRYSGTYVKLVGPEDELPLSMVWATGKKAVFIQLVAAIVLLLFAFNINEMLPDHLLGDHATLVKKYLPLVMFAVSAYLGLRGLFGLVARTEVEIDGRTVSVSAPYRLWGREWAEPLSNYQGVRWNRYAIHEERQGGDAIRTRYLHVIDLVHPNANRTIPLFVRKTGRANIFDALAWKVFAEKPRSGDPRATWESLAAMLELPAIDARDGAYEVRDSDDLDKSIQTLSDEGKLRADWQDASPPPSLAVERGGDADDVASQELRITFHVTHIPNVFFYLLGGVGGVLFVAGVLSLTFRSIFGGLLFGGIAFGIWYLQRKNPSRLTVTRREIRYHDPLVASRGFTMPLSAIESITIRDRDSRSAHHKTLKLSGKRLLISTDQAERSVGGGLDEEALRWLRDYLVAAVARA
jgi:hypothetical protein